MENKKIILITGASGFIGHNACNYFLKNGWKVFGLADKGAVPIGVLPMHVNLLNFKKLKKEIKKIKPSVVLHLGALVVLDRSYTVAKKCIDVNIKGTLNLVESLKDVDLNKFIYFSTEEVYGGNKVPFMESQIPFPPSPYSISKVAGENFCLLYRDLYNFPAVVLRIATIFGYNQPKSRFIPNMIVQAINNKPILLNSGKNMRDYLFVDSLLDAINKIIKSRNAIGEIFNIGHANSLSGKDLAEKIIKLSGSQSKIVLNSFPDREGESKIWKMNNIKAKKILNWMPEKSIDDNLIKTINFYKNKLS